MTSGPAVPSGGSVGPGSTRSSDFVVLPAIDLRGGRDVRLSQGDFDRETTYGDDPVAVAETFAAARATWLHVVDLDGARAGEPVQLDVVARIVRAVAARGVRCEVAGGLRSSEAVKRAFDAGAARVAVGTAAVRDPAFAAELMGRHGPDAVVVALDVRDGLALGEGWRAGAPGMPAHDALVALAAVGVQRFEVTAIERDGLMGGPNLELLSRLVGVGSVHIIASGGVRSVADLRAVRDLGCDGAIVGRAIYDGHIDVAEAIRELDRGD
jgi:phosphoribosylformimino-5-aminoimidazole carboxamide ribotide isomerase